MPRKTYSDRAYWTPAEIGIVERYMDDADRRKVYARWDLLEEEIGHPVSSIRSMAHYIRSRRRAAAARNVRKTLRAVADAFATPDAAPSPAPAFAGLRPDKPVYRGKLPAEKPAKPIEIADTMRCTSTAQLMLHSEIRARTGNWFGDPPPGRSALDEMRAGIVRPTPNVRGMHVQRKPTLATKVAL